MALADRKRGGKVSDNLSSNEIQELERVAEWLDGVYVRLQGAELVLATNAGNDRYCESLQADIERVAKIGIDLNRPVESLSCLFEAMNGDHNPNDFVLRARAEVNAIAIALRQVAIDEHRDAKQQTKGYPILKQMYQDAQTNTKLSKGEKTYRKVVARYWKTLDTNDRPTEEQLYRWLSRPENH